MNAEEVRHLAEVFKNTLQPEKETRVRAETELVRLASTKQDYANLVLQVVASIMYPLEIRLAAAVNFKNYVRSYWASDPSTESPSIPDNEKNQIRSMLVEVMLCTPFEVRSQVGEALNLISIKDFPQKWPDLIPSLALQLDSNQLNIQRGVLETANSVFKRFRNTYMSETVSNDLELSQKGMLKPLIESLRSLNKQLNTHDRAQLEEVCWCVRLVFRIFYSLNVFGITEMMEGDLKEWMRHLYAYLELKHPLLENYNSDVISPLDSMKAAVCDILNLFIQINDEDFEEYVEPFVQAVSRLLSTITLHPCQDKLVIAAINFLTGVAKGPHTNVFRQENVLQHIFTVVIIPSLKLRPDDLELFENNGLEYIRRDTEGSNSDTRRRSAADLVRALADLFPNEVTRLCTSYIGTLLDEYARNPRENYISKDCAVFMVVALTVKGTTASMGATTLNAFVPLMEFWTEQIEPELVDTSGMYQSPLLKADALKFLTTFRMHIPRDIMITVLPNIIQLLRAENFVVHSYAATLIERLIVLTENRTSIFSPPDLMAYLQALLENLFGAFEFPDSAENPYVMLCVMRVIEFVGPGIQPVAHVCLQTLARKLLEVCQNPQGPAFNHYLFESVAALILAEFIDMRQAPLPDVYFSVLRPALTPFLWERAGNVPALAKLIRAYIRKTPDVIVQQNHLESILGIFQKLNSQKATEEQALLILQDVFRCLPIEALELYQSRIWSILFERFQTGKTANYTKAFFRFISLVLLHLGVIQLNEVLEKVQPGVFFLLLERIWVPSFHLVQKSADRKICCCALIKILTEFSPLVMRAPALWGQLLTVLVKQMQEAPSATPTVPPEKEETALEDFTGYSASFAQLRNVKLSFEMEDLFAADPKLVNALAALNAALNNQLGPIIQQHVTQEVATKLSELMKSGLN